MCHGLVVKLLQSLPFLAKAKLLFLFTVTLKSSLKSTYIFLSQSKLCNQDQSVQLVESLQE
jgi:hypothetical protein